MEQICDITECCICRELFTDPRMLPCIHTFCLKCLEATRSISEKNPGDKMPCPLCRQRFTIPPDGLSGQRKNYFTERLTEIAKISKPLKTAVSCDVCLVNKDDADIEIPDASKYCVDCRENMCEFCSVQHKRQKFGRDYQIVHFGSQLKDELVKTFEAKYCSQHNKEELKMYCADCKTVICIMCFAENHQMHKCSDVNKVAGVFREEIGSFPAKFIECSKVGLANKLKLEEEKRQPLEESEIAETMIKQRSNELKQLIDMHAEVLLDELVQRKATRMKETENKNEEIERYLATVHSFNAYCSEIKSKGTPTDICRSVHDLRARANDLQQINAPQIKDDTPAVHISFKTSEIEDILKVQNIVGSLEVVEQHESPAKLKTRKEKPVILDLMERIQCPINVQAVTKLDDKIYALGRQELGWLGGWTELCIFEDRIPFQGYKNFKIRRIFACKHVVSSDKLKCLYIHDSEKSCIWKLTADDCQVTQWLPILGGQLLILSRSRDGHPMILRDSKGVSQVEIYESDAKIIRSISLSRGIKSPLHIIQQSNGQFIVTHKSSFSISGSWVISELGSEGQTRQFHSKEKCQDLMIPYHLPLDSENDRLFVAQTNDFKSSVVMFHLGSFQWKQVLLTEPLPYWRPSLHYDERKKQLLVGKLKEVGVYQIS